MTFLELFSLLKKYKVSLKELARRCQMRRDDLAALELSDLHALPESIETFMEAIKTRAKKEIPKADFNSFSHQ